MPGRLFEWKAKDFIEPDRLEAAARHALGLLLPGFVVMDAVIGEGYEREERGSERHRIRRKCTEGFFYVTTKREEIEMGVRGPGWGRITEVHAYDLPDGVELRLECHSGIDTGLPVTVCGYLCGEPNRVEAVLSALRLQFPQIV